MTLSPKQRATVERLLESMWARLEFDDALALAIEERTGKEAEPGASYTVEDYDRAREIFAICHQNRPIRHCSGRRSIMGGCRIANCTPRFLEFGRRGRWNG
jgi:hypothetical protein